jgi:transposase
VDKQTREVKTKRRRSRAEIQQLVAEYEASGLGCTAFCQQRGLTLSTLARYRRRQEQTAGEAAEGKRWLAVEVSGSAVVTSPEKASGLAVVVPGGRRIEVGRGFDADTLQRLLAVVERG